MSANTQSTPEPEDKKDTGTRRSQLVRMLQAIAGKNYLTDHDTRFCESVQRALAAEFGLVIQPSTHPAQQNAQRR